MPKCSKYHAKWQILVPNCCKHKAGGTRKESQQKFQNLSKQFKKLFCTHSEMPEITLLFFTLASALPEVKICRELNMLRFFRSAKKDTLEFTRVPKSHKKNSPKWNELESGRFVRLQNFAVLICPKVVLKILLCRLFKPSLRPHKRGMEHRSDNYRRFGNYDLETTLWELRLGN